MIRRSFWGLGDQAIVSISNLLFALMVARVSTPEVVGAWAVTYAAFIFVLSVSRASISTTALIASTEEFDGEYDDTDNGAVSLCLFFGLASGLLIAALGLLFSGSLRAFFVFFGIVLPIMLLQDSLRYTFIRRGRPDLSFAMDATWLFFQVVVAIAVSGAMPGAIGVASGWAAGALASVGVGLLIYRRLVSLKSACRFIRRHARIGSKLLLDAMISASTASMLPVLLGIVLGLAATGNFRSGMTLLGVVGIFLAGATPIATVEVLSRVENRKFLDRFMLLWSSAVAAIGVGLMITLRLLPDWAGVQLVGETWYGTYAILVPMTLQVILRGPMSGIEIVFRAMRRIGLSITLRLIYGVNVLLVTTVGAVFWGISGAAWAWALSSAIGSVLALAFYFRVRKAGSCE